MLTRDSAALADRATAAAVTLRRIDEARRGPSGTTSQMRSLFLPQRGDRIDSRCTEGVDGGREEPNGEQHRDRWHEDHRIGGGDSGDEGSRRGSL